MTGRKPKKDELELWHRVARSARPLPKAAAPADFLAKPKPRPAPPSEAGFTLRPFRMGGNAGPVKDDLAPSIAQNLGAQPVRMDSKAFRALRRGKLKPDARIDLHGMTQARAHAALTRFVLDAHGAGRRLLLVITGKGKSTDDGGPIPVRHGVLRHQVPEWLRLPPLGPVVLQVAQAHAAHGGSGAYYVYLRRPR